MDWIAGVTRISYYRRSEWKWWNSFVVKTEEALAEQMNRDRDHYRTTRNPDQWKEIARVRRTSLYNGRWCNKIYVHARILSTWHNKIQWTFERIKLMNTSATVQASVEKLRLWSGRFHVGNSNVDMANNTKNENDNNCALCGISVTD